MKKFRFVFICIVVLLVVSACSKQYGIATLSTF